MSKKLWLFAVVYSMVVHSTQASDDVYVDLSVLDAVSQDSIGFVQSAPLFPEVKVDTSKKIHKKTIKKKQRTSQKLKAKNNRKNNNKVATPTVSKIDTAKKTEKVQILSEKTPSQAKVVDKVEGSVDKTEKIVSVENTSNKILAVQADENIKKNQTIEEPIPAVENKKEELTPDVDISSKKDENKKEELTPDVDISSKKDENKEVGVATDSAIVSKTVNNTVSQDNSIQPSSEILSAKVSDKDMIQNTELAPKEVFSIPFVDDLTELSPEAKENIDRAIQEFDAEKNKKIHIKAYNYNNGEDVFRKKRISLNRATEVRSYLLSKGFKNFSIKIINTNNENEYKNTVEIEEID